MVELSQGQEHPATQQPTSAPTPAHWQGRSRVSPPHPGTRRVKLMKCITGALEMPRLLLMLKWFLPAQVLLSANLILQSHATRLSVGGLGELCYQSQSQKF